MIHLNIQAQRIFNKLLLKGFYSNRPVNLSPTDKQSEYAVKKFRQGLLAISKREPSHTENCKTVTVRCSDTDTELYSIILNSREILHENQQC